MPYRPSHPKHHLQQMVTSVTIAVYSDTLTAEQIAGVLGLEPDWAVGAGVEAQATDAPLPSNGWFLESFGNVDSPELDDHLAWALDRLAGCSAALVTLRDQECEVVLGWDIAATQSHTSGGVIPATRLRQLADLGVDVELTLWGR